MQANSLSKSIILLIVSLFCFSFQSQAYTLLGSKWSGGAYNYYINPKDVDNVNNDYSAYTSSVTSGAGLWTSVGTSNVQVNYMGTTTNTEWGGTWPPDYQNTVTWKTTGWSGSVIGLSFYWNLGSSIVDSDIKLNTAFAADSRLPRLVTHEVGHSLGIGHTRESGESYTSNEYNSIMYWLLHSQTELNSEDKCAITAIYPASSSCAPPSGAGYHACTSCCSGEAPEPEDVSVDISNNTYTYNGNSQNVTVATTPSGLSYDVTYYDQYNNLVSNPINAGTYDVVVTITESGYESYGPFSGTLKINKKSLIAYADNKLVNYGAAEPTYTVSYSGFISGEDQSDLATAPVAFVSISWPANPADYTIYLSEGSDENYSLSYDYGVLTVNPLILNNITASNNLYTYDGMVKNITVVTAPLDVNCIVTYRKDGVSVANPTDAGTYIATITIAEPGYLSESYYAYLTIDKAPLSITANSTTVLFGSPEPTFSATYSGWVNGETIAVIDQLPTFYVEGKWPLLPGNYTILVSGGSDNNYSFLPQTGSLTVSLATVDSVAFTNLFYTYDGVNHRATITTYPANVDYLVSYFDSVNNKVDTVKDAGIYTIEVAIVDSGYVPQSFYKPLKIEKATLLAVAKDTAVFYGVPEPNYSIVFSGFVAGEDTSVIDVLPQPTVDGEWPLLPGNYLIEVSAGGDDNYDIIVRNDTLKVKSNNAVVAISDTIKTYTGMPQQATVLVTPLLVRREIVYFDEGNDSISPPTLPGNYKVQVKITEIGYTSTVVKSSFLISKANLTVKVDNEMINYGDSLPVFNYSMSGYVAGDDDSVISVLPTIKFSAEELLLPGDYPIKASGGEADNYKFTYVDGTLTVKPLKADTILVSDTLFNYNGLEHSVTVNTVPSGLNYKVDYFDVNNNPATIENAGVYNFTVTITERGYLGSTQNGNVRVQQLPLTVRMDTIDLVYGQDSLMFKLTIDGFIEGEGLSNLKTTPLVEEITNWPWNVGSHALELFGAEALNYSFLYSDGVINIHPASLEVKVNDYSINYGDSLPAFAYSISGFVYNQSSSVLASLPTVFLESTDSLLQPGSYNLIASGGEALNYGFVYETGRLWVEPVGYATIIISDTSAIYSGLLHNIAVETNPVGLGYNVEYDGNMIDARTYNATVILNEPGYLAQKDSAVFVISKALLTVSVQNDTMLTSTELPDFNFTFDGFVNNEDEDVIDKMPVAGITAQHPVAAGVYPIVLSGGEDNNYDFEYIDGSLAVLQAYTVTVYSEGNGLVALGTNGEKQDSVQELIIANGNSSDYYAVADNGYLFLRWDNGETKNPISFQNVNRDITIGAIFSPKVGVEILGQSNIQMKVFPNPVHENQQVNISLELSDDEYLSSEIVVTDILGRQVSRLQKLKPENQLTGLRPGLYTLSLLLIDGRMEYKKLIVK